MDDISIPTGETGRIVTVARDSAGAGVTGATIDLAIRRNADGYWWNGTTFQSSATTVTMTETDSSDLPGVYHVDFSSANDMTGIVYITTATAGVTNDPMVATILVGSFLDTLDEQISNVASASDMTVILSRLGMSFLDTEFLRINAKLRDITMKLDKLSK